MSSRGGIRGKDPADKRFGLGYIGMGVDHRGTRKTSPPELGVGNANANPQILSYGHKKERCGLLNTPKSVSGQGSGPDPAVGAHDPPLQTPWTARYGTHLPITDRTRH